MSDADEHRAVGGETADVALLRFRAAFLSTIREPDLPDLTLRALGVLLVVADDRVPHTVRHMAEHLKVQKPAVTRALDTLEAEAFVRRQPDLEDRRSVFGVITAAGRRFLTRIARAAAAAEVPN